MKESAELIRNLIRHGDTRAAIQSLYHLLADVPNGETLQRSVMVLEQEYAAVKQQEINGILGFQEARRQHNRISHALLELLDDAVNGRFVRDNPANKRRWLWIAIGAAVAIISCAVWVLLADKGAADCPTFSASGKRVLILPFANIGGKDFRPEIALQERIRMLSEKNNFPLSVELLKRPELTDENPDHASIRPLAERCGADMVIWGAYDFTSDSLLLQTKYLIVDIKRSESGSSGFQPFKNALNMQSGMLLSGLDDAVLSLCGLMAIQDNKLELAEKWLKKVKNPGEPVKEILNKGLNQ